MALRGPCLAAVPAVERPGWFEIGRQAELLASGQGVVDEVVGRLLKGLTLFSEDDSVSGDPNEKFLEAEAEGRRWRAAYNELLDEFVTADQRVTELQDRCDRVAAERFVVDTANIDLRKQIEDFNSRTAVSLQDLSAVQRRLDDHVAGPDTCLATLRAEIGRLERSANRWRSSPVDSPKGRTPLCSESSEMDSPPRRSAAASLDVSPSPSARSHFGASKSRPHLRSRTVPCSPARTPPIAASEFTEDEVATPTISCERPREVSKRALPLKGRRPCASLLKRSPGRLQSALISMPAARTVPSTPARTVPSSPAHSPQRSPSVLNYAHSAEDLFDLGSATTRTGRLSPPAGTGLSRCAGTPSRNFRKGGSMNIAVVQTARDTDDSRRSPPERPRGTPPRSRYHCGKVHSGSGAKTPVRRRGTDPERGWERGRGAVSASP